MFYTRSFLATKWSNLFNGTNFVRRVLSHKFCHAFSFFFPWICNWFAQCLHTCVSSLNPTNMLHLQVMVLLTLSIHLMWFLRSFHNTFFIARRLLLMSGSSAGVHAWFVKKMGHQDRAEEKKRERPLRGEEDEVPGREGGWRSGRWAASDKAFAHPFADSRGSLGTTVWQARGWGLPTTPEETSAGWHADVDQEACRDASGGGAVKEEIQDGLLQLHDGGHQHFNSWEGKWVGF